MKMGFMLNRLRRMSFGEIIYRVNRKLVSEFEKRQQSPTFSSGWFSIEKAVSDETQFSADVVQTPRTSGARRYSLRELVPDSFRYKRLTKFEKRNLVSGHSDYTLTGTEGKLFYKLPEIRNSTDLIKLADRLCENKMDIFALHDFDVGVPIQYHKDYKSGKSAPANVFGKSIDYRDEEKNGDIKYIWELNRQLFLVPLALSYKITGDMKYIKKLEYFISEWLRQNTFMMGVNWASSLELGIRLINWTLCWHLAGDVINAHIKEEWLKSIYRHCWFIHRNYSFFSSANNHLIGEAAGIFIACTALPGFEKTAKWRQKAYNLLARECQKQNFGDGVNKEQALSYQQFVLDFLLLAGLSGKANGIEFPAEYWFVVEKMLVYLLTIKDVSDNFPHIGDEDDGYVVELMQREYGAYRSLINTGAYLFGREDFLQTDHEKDFKTSVFLNIGNFTKDRKEWRNEKLPSKFEQGGYYLLGRGFGTEHEQKLIFDCGTLGYLSLAAHGHADALSFVLSAGGRPVIIDPGTFAYHTNEQWRNYFRGTAAHNTVVVDGRDQSEITGNFMWGRQAKARILAYEDLGHAVGIHDGYMTLKDKVMHKREIRFDEESGSWRLIDEFQCKGKHSIALYFHLHPECRVTTEGNKVVVDFGKGIFSITFDEVMQLTVHRGESDPISGWYSPSYDVRQETDTLRLDGRINGNTKIITSFKVDFMK